MMGYVDNYVTPELIQIVVNQTILYAQQQIATVPRPITKYARSEQWKPVTIYEMKKCLGLMFLTGVIRIPKLEWYWSTRSILLTPIFSQMMSRNRFQITTDTYTSTTILQWEQMKIDCTKFDQY
jgi:hypothetical protein